MIEKELKVLKGVTGLFFFVVVAKFCAGLFLSAWQTRTDSPPVSLAPEDVLFTRDPVRRTWTLSDTKFHCILNKFHEWQSLKKQFKIFREIYVSTYLDLDLEN